MPYIPQARRTAIDSGQAPKTAGELNYALTRTVLRYIVLKDVSYQSINDVSGAFTEAAAEFRRRVTAPYEHRKIVEHGDAYPELLR